MKKAQNSFKEVLNILNAEQKLAVETIDGPVIVIAGPGTGKTQILAARIGNILLKTDTKANEILCVTYTDAGAVEMRNRLNTFIGSVAYDIQIHTFHSFCNTVILNNPECFSDHANLRPINDLEKTQLIKKMIDSWSIETSLKKAKNPYYNVYKLLSLFSYIKRENYTQEEFIARIDLDIQGIEEDEANISTRGKTKGQLKATSINLIKRLKITKEATLHFNEFEQLKMESGWYDFDDMIQWVLKAFKENKDLLLEYSEQFLYFLVDEFQDSNGSQAELIYQLCSFWEHPNVFVVGDDDQSIFRFQGANFTNILEFNNRFRNQNLTAVVLKNNYRSVPGVINAATALIQHNNQRLVNNIERLSKELISANPIRMNSSIRPLLIECKNPIEQDAEILKKILQLKENGEEYKDIAILYKTHKSVDNLVKMFNLNEIPFSIKRKENILTNPKLLALINILKYIQGEIDHPMSQESILFQIMHYEWFGMEAIHIAKLHRSWYEQRKEGVGSFREWIGVKVIEAKNEDDLFNLKLRDFFHLLDLWFKQINTSTTQLFIESVYKNSGFLNYILKSSEKRYLLEVLSSFMNFVKDHSDKNQNCQLKEILSVIEEMKEEKIKIFIERNIITQQGVYLSSLHGSKGLQFKNVFIYDCSEDQWEKASTGSNRNFKLPLEQKEEEKKINEEEIRRLMFVGITRAQEKLFMTYSKTKENGNERSLSKFVVEMKEFNTIDLIESNIPSDELEKHYADLFQSETLLNEKILDPDWLKSLLQDYTLNPTALNKYLRCPITFFFENILRVPSGRSSNIGFGNAIHYALEKLLNQFDVSNASTTKLKKLIEYFDIGMELSHSHFTPQEYKDQLAFGHKILASYYDSKIEHWKSLKEYKTEFSIKNVALDGIYLSGNIDLIEIEKDQVSVIDYKTGKTDKNKVNTPSKERDLNRENYLTSNDPIVRSKEKIKWLGTDYWRQLVFYNILVSLDPRLNKPASNGIMEFIVPDDKDQQLKVKHSITQGCQDIVIQQIKETYQNIQNHEFRQGCSLPTCTWCNFVSKDMPEYKDAPTAAE